MLALCWPLAWAFEYAPAYKLPVKLLYDCTAAGRDTCRASLPPTVSGEVQSLAQRVPSLRHCVQNRVDLHHEHVPGHVGDVGNELCDELAKTARRNASWHGSRCHPTWPAALLAHPLLGWAWLVVRPFSDLPTLFALKSEAARLQTTRFRIQALPELCSHTLTGSHTFYMFCSPGFRA